VNDKGIVIAGSAFLITGVIILIIFMVTAIFFPHLLAAMILLGLGGGIAYNQLTKSSKEQNEKVLGGAIILILVGMVFGIGIIPLSVVGQGEFGTDIQGQIPQTSLTVKPNFEVVTVSNELQGFYQYTYTEYCEAQELPSMIKPSEVYNVGFSLHPLTTSVVPFQTPIISNNVLANSDLVNRISLGQVHVNLAPHIKIDGEKIIGGNLAGSNGNKCTMNSGQLQQLFSGINIFGLDTSGVNNTGLSVFSGNIIIPSDLSVGNHTMSLWVTETYSNLNGVYPNISDDYEVVSWNIEVVEETVIICGVGTELVGSTCEVITCDVDEELVGNSCVPFNIEEPLPIQIDYTLVGGVLVTILLVVGLYFAFVRKPKKRR
jgi:hypothetical protein